MFNWLLGPHPDKHLHAKHADGSLARELPQVERLYGVPQRAEHHPEVDTGVHIELCLAAAASLNASPAARFAVLMHDLGKAVTDKRRWPAHVDHETLGVPLVLEVCAQHGIESYSGALAALVCEFHLHAHRAFEMRPQSIIALLEGKPLLRVEHLLEDFLVACEADARGRLGKHDTDYRQGRYLRRCAEALRSSPSPDTAPAQSREWQDLHRARLDVLKRIRKDFDIDKASTAMC